MKHLAWAIPAFLFAVVIVRVTVVPPTPRAAAPAAAIDPPVPATTAPQADWNAYATAVERRGGEVEQTLAPEMLQKPEVQERLRVLKMTREERHAEMKAKLDREADEQRAAAAQRIREQRERLKAAGIDPDAPHEDIIGPVTIPPLDPKANRPK